MPKESPESEQSAAQGNAGRGATKPLAREAVAVAGHTSALVTPSERTAQDVVDQVNSLSINAGASRGMDEQSIFIGSVVHADGRWGWRAQLPRMGWLKITMIKGVISSLLVIENITVGSDFAGDMAVYESIAIDDVNVLFYGHFTGNALSTEKTWKVTGRSKNDKITKVLSSIEDFINGHGFKPEDYREFLDQVRDALRDVVARQSRLAKTDARSDVASGELGAERNAALAAAPLLKPGRPAMSSDEIRRLAQIVAREIPASNAERDRARKRLNTLKWRAKKAGHGSD